MAENLETTKVEVEEENTSATEEKKGKYYTEEEIELIKQKEGDKRISQYQKTLDKRNREASKLAKMSDEERFVYELEERERALEEKERALTLAENKAAVSKILAEKGLSQSLVDFCVDEDAEKMDAKIKALDKAFKASVKSEVENRLRTNTPRKALNADEGVTVDSFKKMSLSEQNRLYQESPEVYKSIVEQMKNF